MNFLINPELFTWRVNHSGKSSGVSKSVPHRYIQNFKKILQLGKFIDN